MPFALTPEREKKVEEVLRRYPTKRAAMLPVLWICQEQHGWVAPEVVEYVARRLDVSTAAVQSVITFYTLFFEHPTAPHRIWVCRTLSCELRGAKAIQEHLEERLGCGPGGTSRCGKFTLLKAECLAACGRAPMVQIDDRYYEDLTIEKLDRILDEIAAATPTPESGGVRDREGADEDPSAPAEA